MLAPARIPVAAGKKMAKTEKNVSSRKSGPMFSHRSEPERSEEGWVWKDQTGIQDHDVLRMWLYHHNQRSQMPSWIRRKWRFQWSSWWWLWSGLSAGRFGPAQKEKCRVRTETPPWSENRCCCCFILWPPTPFLPQRCPGEGWPWWCRWFGCRWYCPSWWHLHPVRNERNHTTIHIGSASRTS